MQLHIRQKLKWLQIQSVTNSKLTEIYYDRTIYNEFQVDRNIQWNLNHENHATQPVDRKNWHLNSLAAIQFIPIYLCSGSSNPNAHRTEPSHVHNMIRDGGTHCRPAQDALYRAIALPWSPARCAPLSPGAHAIASHQAHGGVLGAGDKAMAAATEVIASFLFWPEIDYFSQRGTDLSMLDGEEKRAGGYLHKDEVSWTHYGGIRDPD